MIVRVYASVCVFACAYALVLVESSCSAVSFMYTKIIMLGLSIMRRCAVLCCAVLCCAVLCCAVLFYAVLSVPY